LTQKNLKKKFSNYFLVSVNKSAFKYTGRMGAFAAIKSSGLVGV